jgi:26S proteasome regulatory subunit N5
MEVIQWTALWETYKTEFENEIVSGKFLSEKAAEDLKQRIIEHVID